MAQSEAQLEEDLIKRLGGMGYTRVTINDSAALLANFKAELEAHNNCPPLTATEFERVLTQLDKGSVFDRAKTLRDRVLIKRDDGTDLRLQLLNTEEWCKNRFQVTNQVSQEGTYKNRYDVTILINGLPLVQIELKRRGIELKEAFNQINRYQRHSFWTTRGLFNYVQLFVISNGVNTKYYANNRKQSFKQTFYWADKENNPITQLSAFADEFLEPCHVSKMICRYTVLQETDKVLMVLRPYQYYAVEAIIDRVTTNPRENGYIWHTTGSGKTLTSFKAAQILTRIPKIKKTVFVVDRADLDYQTLKEFNAFKKDSVDGTSDTKELVKQFKDDSTKLIVTTIQKLNNAITKAHHAKVMDAFKNERIVFIFDECHRSQFGETHNAITKHFTRAQMIGFTGTPIFEPNAGRNALGRRTTKDLFGDRLHSYVITDAIRDENVLKFAVEYWGKLKRKDGSAPDDEEVAGIDTKEFFEDPDRIAKNVDWIIANHDRKTHKRDFTAMMAVGSVDALITYYETFKRKRLAGEHDLRVATIFSYAANEEDAEANGEISDPDIDGVPDGNKHSYSREKLDQYIGEYNQTFGTGFSTKQQGGFYSYYKDIAKRVKERDRAGALDKDRVDILLVVNMFLTGFDARKLNTLYVDKNLKYHGLIQAFSRTNRILNEVKSQGNIVSFRNLKAKTDEAITLFSDKNPTEDILIEPYEDYVAEFNTAVDELRALVPTVDSVNDLKDEEEEARFVQAFRRLMRLLNILRSFAEFSWADLGMSEQEFEDYKSKYLDIYDKVKAEREDQEKVSILDDLDFELELIQRDEINVAYILRLLAQVKEAEDSDDPEQRDNAERLRKNIMDLLGSELQLRSKRDLIEQFIEQNMPKISRAEDVEEAFEGYWTEERQKALSSLCEAEGMDSVAVEKIVSDYHFSKKEPLRDTIVGALTSKPKIKERSAIIKRVKAKIMDLIVTFDDV